MSALRVQGPLPVTWSLLLPTRTAQRATAQRYARLGYKYIVGWKDVQGFGLYVVKCAVGIKAGDAPYVNLI